MSSDEAVEFDGIVDRVATAATEVAATELPVKMRREGTFGVLPAEIATSLVMVLNELLINAVEHGFPAPRTTPAAGGAARRATGEVVVSAHRFRKQLHVTVADNGQGLPRGLPRRRQRAAGPADRPGAGHRRAARQHRAAQPGRRRHRGGPGRPARQALSGPVRRVRRAGP